jgi:shikimate 5-dehydrogenase
MKRFGLIGHPIEHSLSPALFRAGYDGRYPYELIQTDDFEEAYARFLAGYDGINVTAPFKELAIRKADILSEECQAIGATNLLIKTPEGIKAYNSDYLGVRLWIKMTSEGLKSVLPPKVLIVGTGGAGKAAAEAARSLDCEVILMNRTQHSEDIRPLSELRDAFKAADIVIYNLPVRMSELDLLGKEDFIEDKAKHILEANYRNPSFDKELIVKLKGHHPMLEYTGGETWLLLQALTGYEIFTGEKPDLEKMTACL